MGIPKLHSIPYEKLCWDYRRQTHIKGERKGYLLLLNVRSNNLKCFGHIEPNVGDIITSHGQHSGQQRLGGHLTPTHFTHDLHAIKPSYINHTAETVYTNIVSILIFKFMGAKASCIGFLIGEVIFLVILLITESSTVFSELIITVNNKLKYILKIKHHNYCICTLMQLRQVMRWR